MYVVAKSLSSVFYGMYHALKVIILLFTHLVNNGF